MLGLSPRHELHHPGSLWEWTFVRHDHELLLLGPQHVLLFGGNTDMLGDDFGDAGHAMPAAEGGVLRLRPRTHKLPAGEEGEHEQQQEKQEQHEREHEHEQISWHQTTSTPSSSSSSPPDLPVWSTEGCRAVAAAGIRAVAVDASPDPQVDAMRVHIFELLP